MKTYVSDKYLGKDTIDINYDTINHYLIESKKYLCLEENDLNPTISSKEISSYFIANEKNGIGLCTIDSTNGNSNTTYYEDEEWCDVFSEFATENTYYNDFSKLENIKNIINYNILMMNEKNNNYKILNEIPNLAIRDINDLIIGIAKECYIIKSRSNSYYLLLNKIIANKISELQPFSLTIEIDGINYSLWRRYNDGTFSYKQSMGLMIFETREYDYPYTTTISSVTNDNDIEIDNDDYNDSALNVNYEYLLNLIYNDEFSDIDRASAVKEFNKHYNDVFKRKIDLVKYLLS